MTKRMLSVLALSAIFTSAAMAQQCAERAERFLVPAFEEGDTAGFPAYRSHLDSLAPEALLGEVRCLYALSNEPGFGLEDRDLRITIDSSFAGTFLDDVTLVRSTGDVVVVGQQRIHGCLHG